MKFIKLTMKNSDGDNIYLSLDEIACMQERRDLSDPTKHFCTTIFTKNIDILSVKETPEEIMEMICEFYSEERRQNLRDSRWKNYL